ncbi:actin-interacting protein [Pseudoscourfieldia marina]
MELSTVRAALPTTSRGRATLLGIHAQSNIVLYGSAKTVLLLPLIGDGSADCYNGHAHNVTAAQCSPNGEWVASGDSSGKVIVWSRNGSRDKPKLECQALGGGVDDLCWSFDGQRIVASGDGRGVLVKAFMWDSGNTVGEFDGLSKRVNTVAMRPKRPFRVITGSEDSTVNVYNGPPFKFAASHKDIHSKFVNCVRYRPDGEVAVSCSSDGTVRVLDGDTAVALDVVLKDHGGSVYAVAFSPDGSAFCTCSADGTVRGFDISTPATPASTFTLTPGGDGPAAMVAGCAWTDAHVVALTLDGRMHCWPASGSGAAAAPSGAPAKVIGGHQKAIVSCAADTANGQVYSSSFDGSLVQWDSDGLKYRGTIAPHAGQSVVALCCANGLLLTAGVDDSIAAWSLPLSMSPDTSPSWRVQFDKNVSGAPKTISASSSGLIAVATARGAALLSGGAIACPCVAPPADCGSDGANAASISPDGKSCWMGFENGKVACMSVADGGASAELVGEALTRHRGAVTAVSYNPSGTRVATADANREIVVWDAVSRAEAITKMVYHTARVRSLSWSLDGNILASGALDNSLIVWPMTGEPVSRRKTAKQAHAGGISGVAFVGGDKLASFGADCCARLWTVPNGIFDA